MQATGSLCLFRARLAPRAATLRRYAYRTVEKNVFREVEESLPEVREFLREDELVIEHKRLQ